jgi:hypothetical protein
MAPAGKPQRRRKRSRADSKAERDARRAAHKADLEAQAETQGEKIAPAAQRHGVTASRPDRTAPLEETVEIALDGRGRPYGRGKLVSPAAQVTLRGPRVERDGLTFTVSNPIRHLVSRSKGSERPMFTKRHADAADILRHAWEEAGAGVSVGVAQYDRVRGSNIPQTGYISDAALAALDHQIDQREKITRARAWLGEYLWRPIVVVVINGIDASTWAAQDKLNRQVAIGYLAAALDRLAECLLRKSKGGIRAAQIGATKSPELSAQIAPELPAPDPKIPHPRDRDPVNPA